MNKIVSEGIEAATEVAGKIKNSKNKNSGGSFPYKTVLFAIGICALVGYTLANANASKKKN